MPINASLFAHIENDSSLTGTYGLEGNDFRHTVAYLNNYCSWLQATKKTILPAYQALNRQLHELAQIEQQCNSTHQVTDVTLYLHTITMQLAQRILNLAQNDSILIPGGWNNNSTVHRMIYQIRRHQQGYHFIVVNSGEGLQYHAKQSTPEKERYNPAKIWQLPDLNTPQEQEELAYFIQRLLKPLCSSNHQGHKKQTDHSVLYEEILPSISYIGGEEIDANRTIPKHAYTGGQLSGTCTQRVLHQLFKIHSPTKQEYQRFIFAFKHYALLDYFKSLSHITPEIATQLQLAIINNLKILNTPELFQPKVVASYTRTLKQLNNEIKQNTCSVMRDKQKIDTSSYNTLIQHFEDAAFLRLEHHTHHTLIHVPRYNLKFIQKKGYLIHQETKEQVLDVPSPIATQIAGLLLYNKKHEQIRYLIPITRVYATTDNAKIGAFYPVVHDISRIIAQTTLSAYWAKLPPAHIPLWHDTSSERYISIPFKDGKLITKTRAEALYLAYLYLATHQPEHAWHILDACNNLSGDPDELQFIHWICEDLPHILTQQTHNILSTQARKETPPYVACQLKALSLLCHHLQQHGAYPLTAQPQAIDCANAVYEALQRTALIRFIDTIPNTVCYLFSRLQAMRRHLEPLYTLSPSERYNLLDYYYQTQPKELLRGTLGYEWLTLHYEQLCAKYDALNNEQNTSPTQQNKIPPIQDAMEQLPVIYARTTHIIVHNIRVIVPIKSALKKELLSASCLSIVEQWEQCLPGERVNITEIEKAMACLSSVVDDNEFLIHVPAYVQLALNRTTAIEQAKYVQLRQSLIDFCVKTLKANHMMPLHQQDNNILLLCSILYGLIHQTGLSLTADYTLKELIAHLAQNTPPLLHINQAQDIYQMPLLLPIQLERLSTSHPLPADLLAVILDHPLCATKHLHRLLAHHQEYLHPIVEHFLMQQSMNHERLIALAPLVDEPSLLEQLLDHPQMDHQIAGKLMTKKSFSGRIKDWPWLQATQLIALLDVSTVYQYFYKILTHPTLTSAQRAQWLKNLETEQQQREQAQPQDRLSHTVRRLQLKAYSHAIKTLTEPRYQQVAKTAFELSQTLQKLMHQHQHQAIQSTEFKEACQEAIRQAEPILNEHRGYKKILKDIINVLLTTLPWLSHRQCRFFQVNTASMILANDIFAACDIPIDQGF